MLYRKISSYVEEYRRSENDTDICLLGVLPGVVNEYLSSHNIVKVREVQESIIDLYKEDAAKYEEEAERKLHIRS